MKTIHELYMLTILDPTENIRLYESIQDCRDAAENYFKASYSIEDISANNLRTVGKFARISLSGFNDEGELIAVEFTAEPLEVNNFEF